MILIPTTRNLRLVRILSQEVARTTNKDQTTTSDRQRLPGEMFRSPQFFYVLFCFCFCFWISLVQGKKSAISLSENALVLNSLIMNNL